MKKKKRATTINPPTPTWPQSKIQCLLGGEEVAVLLQRLSKYLTAQDHRGTPTLSRPNRTLISLGNLLALQPWSTINVSRVFVLSLVLSKLIKKTKYRSELVTKIVSFSFPKTKQNNTVALKFDHSLFMAIGSIHVHFPPIPPIIFYLK